VEEEMKIYTKQGDMGQTGLVDGSKVSKSDLRIESYGTVDELNSHLGMLQCFIHDSRWSLDHLEPELTLIQNWLFQLGSQLACSDEELAKKLPTISPAEVEKIEQWIDQHDQNLPTLKNFILPGGFIGAAQAHICRTVARRAERHCVELNNVQALNFPAIPFLNRLSDYFFIIARILNTETKHSTPEWKS
jgi:cob(I)alamin adenosyltransferase